MRNGLKIITACALLSGAGYAQEEVTELESIFDVISADPAPVVAVAQPAKAMDVEQAVEKNRKLFVAGEFEKAQVGFEQIVQIAPENKLARMYLRSLQERDQRTAEVSGIEAVQSAWSTDIVMRSYSLDKVAREKLGLAGLEKAKDVQSIFPQIMFPKGAVAVYQPNVQAIYVRNTRENLAVIESVLEAMGLTQLSGDVDQVEIEAKFVEVSEGTLEALGFQWDFDDAVGFSLFGSDLQSDDYSGGLLSSTFRGAGSTAIPFSQRGSLGSGTSSDSSGSAWTSTRMEDSFDSETDSISLSTTSGDALELMISALDQSSGTDVLSAPRVVTKSGQEATIRVGELHNLPNEFTGSNQAQTMLTIEYNGFREVLLGVELSVTPEVNGDQIELALKPCITEIAGWQNYELAAADSFYTHRARAIGMEFEHDAVVAKLPIFKKREIDTRVTMADGSTIGMGGLISEAKVAYSDKVPMLGSLPLVGRLFRSEGERSVKRNLLMFVTARKIDPSGRVNTSRTLD
jgi:type II secretory pathway component GspD/PulD (secretin)